MQQNEPGKLLLRLRVTNMNQTYGSRVNGQTERSKHVGMNEDESVSYRHHMKYLTVFTHALLGSDSEAEVSSLVSDGVS